MWEYYRLNRVKRRHGKYVCAIGFLLSVELHAVSDYFADNLPGHSTNLVVGRGIGIVNMTLVV